MPDPQFPQHQPEGRPPGAGWELPPAKPPETPAARRQRRSRIAAVGASLGAAVVLTGGLALANLGLPSDSSNTNGARTVAHVEPVTGGSDDGYRDYHEGDDDDGGGWWFSDDDGDRRDPGAGVPQDPSASAGRQPSTSSGGS